eukprot:4233124-Amphidinium_carterae.1
MSKGYTAKKGKARMVKRSPGYKRPSRTTSTTSRKPASSPMYTRSSNKPFLRRHANEKDRIHCSMNVKLILSTTERALKTKLIKMGLMTDKRTDRFQYCYWCGSPLAIIRNGGRTYGRRCQCRACPQYRKVQSKPVFIIVDKGSAIGLREQCLVAFNFAIGIKMYQSCFQVGCNHKATERLYQQLRTKLATNVRSAQKGIIFNDTDEWVDCEADEVTVRKRHTTGNRTIWTEYLGIVRRGYPNTLVLLELESRETKRRAPGPGPLRKEEWLKIGADWIADQKVILHSDSAKAYAAELKRVAHTRVVHCKKKINGKWLLPKYVEEVTLTLEDATITVKAGIQYIDGFWRILKEEIRHTSNATSHSFDDFIRTAQWRYWSQGCDPWVSFGKMMNGASQMV